MTAPDVDVFVVTAIVGLAIAVVTDLREHKIPNALTGPLLVMGLALNAVFGQPLVGLIGFAVASLIHFPLWLLGVQKGGDAKLMMAIGAIGGWRLAVETTIWEALVFLPVGLAALAATGKLGNLVAAGKHTFKKAQGIAVGEAPAATYLPFAPVIATAWAFAWLTELFERVL